MTTEDRLLLGSNLKVFFDIAIKAQASSARLDKKYIKPIPGQQGRFVNNYDPRRGSFKNALIAIVFSGVFIEALLSVVALEEPERLTKKRLTFQKFDRLTYENKLKILGVFDENLLEDCKNLREGRNEIVHEKPSVFVKGKLVTPVEKFRVAQTEAKRAVAVVRRVIKALSKRA